MSISNYINQKARNLTVFAFAVVSLIILPFVTIISTATLKEHHGVVLGVGLMIAAIPFHCFAKKHNALYLISFLLNSVANGFSLAALYISKNINLNFDDLIVAIIPSVIILFLTYLTLEKFINAKKLIITVFSIFSGALTITMMIFWIICGDLFFSFSFFGLLLLLFYICVFGITANQNKRSVLRDISFGSFGAFIILTVVVITILSEGELFDGLDLDLGFGEKKKKGK
ncbi:MAG: hypothetical protein IJA44_05245 [Clostridia bacterium]|nr:hypothetical protein [Clostridia bacterium]